MSKVSVALWSFRSNYEHEMHDTLRRFIDIVRIKYCNGRWKPRQCLLEDVQFSRHWLVVECKMLVTTKVR
jgi:hypothetical protein